MKEKQEFEKVTFMKKRSKNVVSIIGGADGPTSIFLAGRSGKKSLKVRIQNYKYRCKSKRAKKKIVAGTHTLEELVTYAMNRYGAIEVNANQRKYVEQRKSLKESLILQHKPELLGEMNNISHPDIYNEDAVRELLEQVQARSEVIAKIPDSEISMDFHIYEIKIDDSYLEMAIDYIWNVFGISYSGNLKKVAQDLYIYYGVSEDDISEKTERYSSLVAALSA